MARYSAVKPSTSVIVQTPLTVVQTPSSVPLVPVIRRLDCNYEFVDYCFFHFAVKRTSSSRYRGSIDCIRKIYKTAGSRGIFQGMSPLLIRDIPGFVVYFASYEILIDFLSQRKSRGDVGLLAPILAGGLAGMISWTSTFPCDVIKSRMQADGNYGQFIYKGFTDCFLKSYRTGGFRSLYTGLGPTLLRAFPTNGIIFFVYNLVSNFYSERSFKVNTELD